MKTKKLFLLTAILMLFTVAVTLAQNVRGGCTSTVAYHNAGNGWVDDTDVAKNSFDIVKTAGLANFTCGISRPRQNVVGSTFTIDVYKNGETVASIHADQTTFTANDYVVTNPIPVAGNTCKVVMTVTPVAGTQGCAGTPWTYTWNLSAATGCIPSVPAFYYQVDGMGSWHDPTAPDVNNAIIIEPMLASTRFEAGVHLNGGTVAWSDGLGFTSTSNQFVYDPKFTTGSEIQTRTLTAAFTTCEKTTNYVYKLTSTDVCVSKDLTPYYNVGSGQVNKTTTDIEITVPMSLKGTITAGINPGLKAGETLVWTGCNAFTATGKEITFDPNFTTIGQTCELKGVYTDVCGLVRTYTYHLSADTECVSKNLTPYYNDGSGWINKTSTDYTINVKLAVQGTIEVGFNPALKTGETLVWTGSNGFSGTAKQFVFNPTLTAQGQTCDLVAVFTDVCGLARTYTFHLSADKPCVVAKPIPGYNIGSGWKDKLTTDKTINIEVNLGATVDVRINPNTGTIDWTGCNGFGVNSQQFSFDPKFTAVGQTCNLVGVYTDTCGNKSTYTYVFSSICSKTLDPYYNDNVSSGWLHKTTTDYTINVSLQTGGNITVGIAPAPKTALGESLVWTGCGGFTGTQQQFTFDPKLTAIGQTCDLLGTFTDACGVKRTYTYHLTATTGCISIPPIPYYNNNNTGWKDLLTTTHDINLEVPIGARVDFGIKSGPGGGTGSNLWNDDISITADRYFIDATGQEKALDGVFTVQGESINITGVYTDKCGLVSAPYIFHLKSPALGVSKFEEGRFSMYPSPAETNLNITFDGDLSVSIINISGQKLLSSFINKQGSIDISGLSSGVYFLKAISNGESIVKKFIKK